MAIPKVISSQTDFSAGELDSTAKRDNDSPITKIGSRQARNWRVLNTGKPTIRPGRTAKYVQTGNGRVDQVRVLPGINYDLCFGGDGSLVVRLSSTGAIVATQVAATYPWATATVDQIVWALVKTGATSSDVVICFPGMKTKLAQFDGVSAWTFADFAFQNDPSGQPYLPFYRIAAPNITMMPSGFTGAITVLFSAAVLNANHVGAYFRFGESRLRIDAVTNSTNANATCIDILPRKETLQTNVPMSVAHQWAVGDLVLGGTTGCEGIVTAINEAASQITVQIINSRLTGFSVGESIVGPKTTNDSVVNLGPFTNPGAIAVWDEQIISDGRGWARSVSSDQGRLIFADLPGAPDTGIWSVEGLPYNFAIGDGNPTDAIADTIVGKPRIYHIMPHAHAGDEICFTDKGIFQIPISPTNPLKPGSIVFAPVTPEAASSVRPVVMQDAMFYVSAGGNRVIGISGDGAAFSTRAYKVYDATAKHGHLFTTVKALALTTGDGNFPERYLYALMTSGAIAMANIRQQIDPDTKEPYYGWLPWDGNGTVNWLSSLQSVLRFTTSYNAGAVAICEELSDAYYMDAIVPINAVPAAIAPPGGKGPLWWYVNSTFELMDGNKPLGPHSIDANGFVVAINAEDLTSATLVAGLTWTSTLEPFIPPAKDGQDLQQRLRKRSIGRAQIYVANSTGFVFATLASEQQGINLPVPGTVVQSRRIPPWNQDDDPNLTPPLREKSYAFRPRGRANDPRCAIIKDTPGPLTPLEIALEVSV